MKYFIKLGYSLIHPSTSVKENWKLALHDPLFLLVSLLIAIVAGLEIYIRYFQ